MLNDVTEVGIEEAQRRSPERVRNRTGVVGIDERTSSLMSLNCRINDEPPIVFG